MSSMYEELCKEYKNAFVKYNSYKKDCYYFAIKLSERMIKYLSCPTENLEFIPENEEYVDGKIFTPVGALNLEDDSYWHMGFILKVTFPDGLIPEKVRFTICFKKTDSHFEIKVAKSGKEFNIDINDNQAFDEFLKDLFEGIMDRYKNGLTEFLNPDGNVRVIGF